MTINIQNTLDNIDMELATYWQDILDMQSTYYTQHGSFVQCHRTHSILPVDGIGSSPDTLDYTLSDQIESWNDLISLPITLKAALTIDVYKTTTVWGWLVTFEVLLNGVIWKKILDQGPFNWDRSWYADDGSAQESLEDIIAHWTLNELSGTRYDSIDTNHLTDYNTVPYTANALLGNAAMFRPANEEYLGRYTNLFANNVDFTVCGWFYIDTTGSENKTQIILRLLENDVGHGWIEWYPGVDPSLKIKLFDAEKTGNGIAMVPANTWHFIEYYYDSINGTLGASLNNGDRFEVTGIIYLEGIINRLLFGALKTGDKPSVRLDHWCFFNRLFTRTELNYLYNNGAARELV